MRDYSLLFGLAVLGLIVSRRQALAAQRQAETPQVIRPPLTPANSKVTPGQFPGPTSK